MKKFISSIAIAMLFMSCREVESITTENKFDVKTEARNKFTVKNDSILTVQNNTTNALEAPKDPPIKDKENW